MSDQADQLRRLVRETVLHDSTLQPGPPLVVVSGSQKGVGTTTIAIQLARELAKQGKRTVLVDANPTHPEVASKWSALEKLSVEPLRRANSEPHGTLTEVLAGDRTVTEALEPMAAGIRILPACWNPEAPPELSNQAIDRLLDGLRRLQDTTDVVVADLGCGMSPWDHRFWLSAQQILLVTTSKPTAVMDSYATLKLAAADALHERVRIVVNRCWEKQQSRAVFTRLNHTCQRFLDFSLSHASTIAEYADVDRQETNINHYQTHADHPEAGPADRFAESCQQAGDFQSSVRLLAAEVISNYLVTIQRRLHPTAAHGAMD